MFWEYEKKGLFGGGGEISRKKCSGHKKSVISIFCSLFLRISRVGKDCRFYPLLPGNLVTRRCPGDGDDRASSMNGNMKLTKLTLIRGYHSRYPPSFPPAQSAGKFCSKEIPNKKFCSRYPPSFPEKTGQGEGVTGVIPPNIGPSLNLTYRFVEKHHYKRSL